MKLALDDGPFGGFYGTDERGGRWHSTFVVSPAIWHWGRCLKPYEQYELWTRIGSRS